MIRTALGVALGIVVFVPLLLVGIVGAVVLIGAFLS